MFDIVPNLAYYKNMTYETYSKNTSFNVQKALEKSGYTIAEAARLTGMARQTLSRHLNNPVHSPFNVIELAALANLTKRSPISFLKEPAKE